MTTPRGTAAGHSTTAPGGSGLPDHVAGTLAYTLGALTGILFFILDRHRPSIRFHALQAIGLTLLWIVLSVGLTVLGMILAMVPVLGWLIDMLLVMALALAGLAIWILLMVQAWRGNRWELPVVGVQVRRIADQMDGGASSGVPRT